MKKILSLLVLFFCSQGNGFSQGMHDHSGNMEQNENSIMSHSFSLNLPMNRNASGTAWLPDESVMYGYGIHHEKWMYMFHHNLFIRYNKQDIFEEGSRGGEKIDAPNWFMFMGQRRVGARGLFRFNSMLSLDPLTVGGEGYPLLFQSGETYQGQPLVDRQHPHDFFSELSVAYSYMINTNADIYAYLAYPGEPAFGPVAFMHRLSALNNPDAPLGHHWQDATHITFGVATVGIRVGMFKIEGSSFTGREPDEERYGFDRPRFDSYSVRLSCNPTPRLALQVSNAQLKSPELINPEDVNRTTASLIYHTNFTGYNSYFTTSVIWGYNRSDHKEHSLLIEPALVYNRKSLYARYEFVQKSAGELALDQFINGHEEAFNIQALTIGTNYIFLRRNNFNSAVGVQGTYFIPDEDLTEIYGETPVSAEVYLRFYPTVMSMTMK